MSDEVLFFQEFSVLGKDFTKAGSVSTEIKSILKEIGFDPAKIRRAAIASYEAEMNIVMYAHQAVLTLNIDPEKIHLNIKDQGPGIKNIEMAMQEGFSTATDEMREMGFGAGMGLPNIKRNADKFEISSIPGQGTTLDVIFCLSQSGEK